MAVSYCNKCHIEIHPTETLCSNCEEGIKMDTHSARYQFVKKHLLDEKASVDEAKKILNTLVDDLLNINYEDLTQIERWVIDKTCNRKI